MGHTLPCHTTASFLPHVEPPFLCASPHKLAMAASSHLSVPPGKVSRRNLRVSNPVGEVLVGVLDDTGSADLVLLCHGFRSSKNGSTLTSLASALTDSGLSTLRFDFSGNGESEGEFQYGNYWKEVEDLRAVILYAANEGCKVKAIVGHSKGGNVVLLYESKYKDVDNVVNLCGRFDLQQGVKERLGESCLETIENEGYVEMKDENGNVAYRVTKEGLKERLSTDMKSAVLMIPKSCRVLTVHGSNDEIINVDEANKFDNLIANHTLRIVDGANHSFNQHRDELASLVIDFLTLRV